MCLVLRVTALTAAIIFFLFGPSPAGCGIPGLHKWFWATFPNAVKEIHKGDVVETDHLLFDMNQLLHQAALAPSAFSSSGNRHLSDSVPAEIRVLRVLRAIINSTFKRFRVKRSIVFALDGVPPVAKLAVSQQRRQRAARAGLLSACIEQTFRAKEGHEEGTAATSPTQGSQGEQEDEHGPDTISPELRGESAARKDGDSGRSGYSIPSYMLSPGTHFMLMVERECKKIAKELIRSQRFGSVKVFISGSLSYGEGELKLADWINVASAPGAKQLPEDASLGAFRIQPSHSIVVIGGDADLVVQCLALPFTSNLFVYNPQAFAKSKRSKVLYSLRAVLGELERLFPGKSHLVRNDFALLCILNGNDYLPKIPGFSFPRFTAAYEATRRRPECANGAWVNAERKSFDWRFFSVFLEELDRLNSFEMVARHREECLRLAVPQSSQSGYKASPLQIVNQLIAQKHIALSDDITGGVSADPLQWCFEEDDGGFVCDVKLPSGGSLHLRRPESSTASPLSSVPTSFASRALSKKAAQQRTAFKLLQCCFPELMHLVAEGPWNTECPEDRSKLLECFPAVSVATFRKAAAMLRATTPSNTLNNLCLAALHTPPTFRFVSDADTVSNETEVSKTELALPPDIERKEKALQQSAVLEKAEQGIGTTISAISRVDVLTSGKVIFSCPVPQGQIRSKAKLRHAISMQALEELAPALYAALRALDWDRDGSHSIEQGNEERHIRTHVSDAATIATPEDPTGDMTMNAGNVQGGSFNETGEEFSIRVHLAKEAEKTTAYLHGLLWNLQMYVDGVCPDNEWHFLYKSAPSLLAVQAAVRRQLEASEDAFSRLSSRSTSCLAAPVSATVSHTPRPISPFLYTASLLPPGALHVLKACEQRLAVAPGASCTQRLMEARAWLKAAAKEEQPSGPQRPPPAETGTEEATGDHGTADSSDKEPTINASTVLLASKLLKKRLAEGSDADGTSGTGLSFLEPDESSYWTVLESGPYEGVNERPSEALGTVHKETAVARRVVTERRLLLFSPSSMNRTWTKPRTDLKLCRFSLHVIRKLPATTRDPHRLHRCTVGPRKSPMHTSIDASTRLGSLPRLTRPPSYNCFSRTTAGHIDQIESRCPVSLFMTLNSKVPRPCPSQSPSPRGFTPPPEVPLQFRERLHDPWQRAKVHALANAPFIRQPPQGNRSARCRCSHTRH